MRQLHFDLLRLLEDDRQGSHDSRRARRYVLAQDADRIGKLERSECSELASSSKRSRKADRRRAGLSAPNPEHDRYAV